MKVGGGLVNDPLDGKDEVEELLLGVRACSSTQSLHPLTFNSAIASTETLSAVYRTASFLVVPVSRRECARTRAPVADRQSEPLTHLRRAKLTWEV